jgi:type III restriction enzyme
VPQVTIENPILNSAFDSPTRHFKFDNDGITREIEHSRRASAFFMPIARARKKGEQAHFDTEWTADRIKPNTEINRVRERVDRWRQGGHVDVTPVTRRLLTYWSDPTREKKLFFCQREAVETAIYLLEVASRYGDAWIDNYLRDRNAEYNAGLPRIAFKMATGSGKTVVMAMLIAWQALNKVENRQDARFSDAFLIVAPGITIRDRLRVLLPTGPDNYYRERDLLPPDMLETLGQARIVITNYHAFIPRERGDAARLTKSILNRGDENPFQETPDQMVRRVCRDLAGKKNIIVINDEAHHCYWRRANAEDETLSADDRAEAKRRDEDARVWSTGLLAVQQKIRVRAVYDMSATPFFLSGSGWPEGTLFPWVVSDFSLIDAIESGIVKIPRVPVADDSMTGELPTYRSIWLRIKDDLPKRGRKAEAIVGEPKLPAELQGALHSLYGHYENVFRRWQASADARARGETPPVFVVVCSNTTVSKLVFDWIAGWDTGRAHPDGAPVAAPGHLALFTNVEHDRWTARPNSILVDSQQLESGEAMSPEFKKLAIAEIEEFKAEYRIRFPGRSVDDLTDEDLLREVMNTVGKAGKLGEQVRCVVSVSMLTEGWDANTVTHVLGVRAFGTQLLCEQVVGRGLRRRSYAANADGRFEPEYADVYGVPFSFLPCSGTGGDPKPGPSVTHVRALEDRIDREIRFPRVQGYKYEFDTERLQPRFTDDSRYALSTEHIPTWVENAPIVGEKSVHSLDDLKSRRPTEVAFLLAKLVLEKYFRADDAEADPAVRPGTSGHRFDAGVKFWLFPQALDISRRWLRECVTYKDNTFPQLLLLLEFAHDAADRIYASIVAGAPGTPALKPLMRPGDAEGSTRYVGFDTSKPVFSTRADKCHVSHVAEDSGWESKLAQSLESMEEVDSYVKNQGLQFTIPYSLNGDDRQYFPDFVVRVGEAGGVKREPLLNLIVEVTGEGRKDKSAKVSAARHLWIPAINNHGGFGRWAFVEVTDPYDAIGTIRAVVREAMATVG